MSTDDSPPQAPNFESIKQLNPYGMEFWSARDLSKLLDYTEWRNFVVALERAKESLRTSNQTVSDHIVDVNKMVTLGSGSQRKVKDYALSRFACYLVAQNGDPRKPAIAAAQAYFATAARANEIAVLHAAQQERLRLRNRVAENNKALAEAAQQAGVLSKNFGVFQNAGYEGLYGGLDVRDIKERKGIAPKEDLLDRMGRAELAANDFRITQTEEKLRRENITGENKAIETHREIGQGVRELIKDFGGTMPENLPPEPTIKPLLDERRRATKRAKPAKTDAGEQAALFDLPPEPK